MVLDPMAINLHQLKIFHTVARSSSFSRAAVELLISQPSVSIQVRELERQLGADLFEQVGKSVRLTEAGRVLDVYAARILALIDEARGAVVVAPSRRFARLAAVRVADLAGERFILRERGSGNREVVDEALHQAGVHITPVFELEGAEMVKQAVAANLGISILWRCAIELDVAAGRLRFVPVEGLE